MKQPEILVFKLDNDGTFDNIGEINKYSSFVWGSSYNGYADFELWAPITSENREYLQAGHILWCGGENAAVIEIVKSVRDANGVQTYDIKGRTLESLLTSRIIWGTAVYNNTFVSDVMYGLVNSQCVSPANTARKIPFLEYDGSIKLGQRISVQKTGGELYDMLTSLAADMDMGFKIIFDPVGKRMIFKVVQGMDRTSNQSAVDKVEFSTDLEDLLESSYYKNIQDNKNIVLVAGEDSGEQRKFNTNDNGGTRGLERKELYVDARDIQSKYTDDAGVEHQIADDIYLNMLLQRGYEKISECQTIENFEAQVRTFGDVQNALGRDFYVGDLITVRDLQLGVTVNARVTKAEEQFGGEYKQFLTFGYSYPTVLDKIKMATG